MRSIVSSLAFARMPRAPVLRTNVTAEGGEVRGGMATGERTVAARVPVFRTRLCYWGRKDPQSLDDADLRSFLL